MTRRVPFVFVLAACLAAGAQSENNPKSARAVRTTVAPVIDGNLNEPQWKLAQPISDFTQQDPDEGAPASQKTEIRILYDDDAIYFGCTMYDNEPSKIVGRLARRDDQPVSDVLSICLDSYHDHQTCFEFIVNAAGLKADILQYNDGVDLDKTWDAVWDAKTSVTSDGWVAEIKIPFHALRFSQQEIYEFGLQVIRRIARNNERQMWALVRKSESGFISKFGRLEGIEKLRPSANLQIIPYVVGSGKFVPASPAFPNGHDFSPNAGFDFKYRPGSGLTIDATINPDFGQVEADPAVLNLTTFETFYPENRPFFIEGTQIIRFTTFGGLAGPGLFYSRRIGRAIQVAAPPGGYVLDQPRFATILGAAKISSKTAGGLSVGVLEAVTRKETATLVDSTGNRTTQVVEPLTNYSLIRLRQDLMANSNVGMILTSVNRDGRPPAMTAGIDWSLKFLESVYRVDGFLAGSRTSNNSSSRVDGTAGKFNFSKDGGPHWRGSLSFDFTAPKYNVNDIGFFRRPNDYGWVGQVLYRDDEVTSLKRLWSLSSMYHLRRNFDGAELINSITLDGQITLPNWWFIDLTASLDRGQYDDRESRGYGLYRKPGTQSLSLDVKSDKRELAVGEVVLTWGSDQRLGRFLSMKGDLELKPASNLTLQFDLERSVRRNEFAWADNVVPAWSSSLAAVSPVFANRTTDNWSLTTRGSYVFATDLTIQVYFQIFLAKGKYDNYQVMLAPDRFTQYPLYARPDFNELSFHSNVVLRWEYLPGSTMYLVWSQARLGGRGTYESTLTDSFSNTFALPSDNVVLLKVSYWLSM
ncbi:MAG: DUF5916 domain-containing protein [Ignavibacteriales bacterium]|nr:DUF5916 domain-containing protein [Ignavibacteriales bacterium]